MRARIYGLTWDEAHELQIYVDYEMLKAIDKFYVIQISNAVDNEDYDLAMVLIKDKQKIEDRLSEYTED